jgi:hypothetical protein
MEQYWGVEVELHHLYFRHEVEVSGQLPVLTILPKGKEPPVPNE